MRPTGSKVLLTIILAGCLTILGGLPIGALGEDKCPKESAAATSCGGNSQRCCRPDGTFSACTGVGNCGAGEDFPAGGGASCSGNQICNPLPGRPEIGTCECPNSSGFGKMEKCDGKTCVDTDRDIANCGGCGNRCITTGGQVCIGGECKCPNNQTECSGRCVNTEADPAHCGGCDTACSAGTKCMAGHCLPGPVPGPVPGPPPNPPPPSPGTGGLDTGPRFLFCHTDETLCDGRCVKTVSDPKNCGVCGKSCGAGSRCIVGRCMPGLAPSIR